jgi:molecular chaperone HscA
MPHEDTVAVGIDLGTTNSIVAISDEGVKQTIRDEEERALMPSVVAYKADGSVLVGVDAVSLIGIEGVEVITSIKRLMGRGIADVKPIAGTLPFAIDESKTEGMVSLKLAHKNVTPVEVSSEILKALKDRAEYALKKDVKKAVITVPAYFDDAARQATKDAARIAGLEVLRLVNEPTAAALAYGLDNAAEGIYAIYDLGGGTFDISILKMEKGVFKVLATAGDTSLGGDDFDHAIAEHIIKENLTEADVAPLQRATRQIKEALSTSDSTTQKVTLSDETKEVTLSRTEFEALIKEHVEKTIAIARRALEDADITPEEVKGVVMVGGSTRVPLVQAKVEAFFGKAPLNNLDPDRVVALGAAAQAEALTRGSDTLLLDVTPLSVGLETMGNLVEKVIHRNTPIPVSESQEFTTYQDGQTAMKIHVLQGEREMVDQCRSLAEFALTGIPPMNAGAARIEVTFNIDADGMLTVSAREETTGKEQKIEVKPTYGLEEDEIEQMLRDSITHAREDITQRLLVEARVEADVALKAVKSALATDGDLLDNNARKTIDEKIAILTEVMQTEDRDAIDYEVQQLDHVCSDFVSKRVNRTIGHALKGKNIDTVEDEVNEKTGTDK